MCIIIDPPDTIDEFRMKKYYKISKDKPAFAIIINNEKFNGNNDRTGTEEDGKNILSLGENFKGTIEFHEHTLKDLTADEMKGAFKMIGNPDLNSLEGQEIRGAIKLFHPPNDKLKKLLEFDIDMQRTFLQGRKIDFRQYSCFMAFIMSHGNMNGIAGTDGKLVEVDTLSSYITPDKCEELKDKPKIFFIQACRGGRIDIVMDEYQESKDGTYVTYVAIYISCAAVRYTWVKTPSVVYKK